MDAATTTVRDVEKALQAAHDLAVRQAALLIEFDDSGLGVGAELGGVAAEGTITDAYGAVTPGNGGNFTAALGTVAAGATKSIYVSYTVPSSTVGDQTNTATVTSSNPANNTTSETDHLAVIADLAITNTDNSPTYTLGELVAYIITVTNNGPSDAVGATVADLVPAMLTEVSWTSSTTAAASVTSGGSGSGNSMAAVVNIAAGAGNSVVFRVSGTVPTDWCVVSGDLINTATVTAPPGTTDPNPANNSATDDDTLSGGQSPITVNSAGDDPSGPSAGTVTLRDAISAVNLGSADAIRIAIPGTPTISLIANLPALDRLVYIDGTTQPGVTVNGNGFTMLDVASNVNVKRFTSQHLPFIAIFRSTPVFQLEQIFFRPS